MFLLQQSVNMNYNFSLKKNIQDELLENSFLLCCLLYLGSFIYTICVKTYLLHSSGNVNTTCCAPQGSIIGPLYLICKCTITFLTFHPGQNRSIEVTLWGWCCKRSAQNILTLCSLQLFVHMVILSICFNSHEAEE